MLELVSVIIVILVSSSLGLVTFYNNPKSATNRIFSLFAVSIIFWAVIMLLSVQPFPPEQQLFFIRLSMLAAIAMSTCVLFLSHTIPAATFQMKKVPAIILLVFACIGMAVAMSPLMFTGLEIKGSNTEPITGPGMLAFLITGLGYSISGIGILLKKYLRSRGKERRQLLYILIGITLMHILLIWANFIVVLVFKSSAYMNLGPLFTLTFLVSTAYAIIRHRLLDIRQIVARAVSFTFLTASLAAIYGLVLFSLPAILPSSYQLPAYITVSIILAYTFAPLRRLVEHLTDNVFHREPYSSEMLLNELGNIIRSTLSISRLAKQVSVSLMDSLHVDYVAFVVANESDQPTVLTYGNTPSLTITNNTMHNLIASSNYQVMFFDDVNESSTKMLMRQLSIGALLPLTVKSVHHGLLLLGQKSSGDIFTNQDVEILNVLLPQLSIAIQNTKSFDEISRFNITLKEEVNKATLDLKKANKHLQHLDKLKDEFVFIATHELKNPVTAMRGYLSMLEEGIFGDVPEKMKEPIDQLQASNQQLVDLVNDLLQIARSEAKTLTLHTEPMDLNSTIDVVSETVKPLAQQKSLIITHTVPTKLPLIQADPQRVKEIINNLLSNAIKYSDKGTITITHEINTTHLVTHVIDQGVGISIEDQNKLFTKFFRAEEEAAKGIPGTGLGLFIVKQLIEKMSGTIWVNSEKGLGSTFSFSLPLAPPATNP